MKEKKEIIYEELSEDEKELYDAFRESGFLDEVRRFQEEEKKKKEEKRISRKAQKRK